MYVVDYPVRVQCYIYEKYMLSVNLVGLKFVSTANNAIMTMPPIGHKYTCMYSTGCEANIRDVLTITYCPAAP